MSAGSAAAALVRPIQAVVRGQKMMEGAGESRRRRRACERAAGRGAARAASLARSLARRVMSASAAPMTSARAHPPPLCPPLPPSIPAARRAHLPYGGHHRAAQPGPVPVSVAGCGSLWVRLVWARAPGANTAQTLRMPCRPAPAACWMSSRCRRTRRPRASPTTRTAASRPAPSFSSARVGGARGTRSCGCRGRLLRAGGRPATAPGRRLWWRRAACAIHRQRNPCLPCLPRAGARWSTRTRWATRASLAPAACSG